MTIPPLLRHLCDDAAIFPPGDMPLAQAVPAHVSHRSSGHSDLVGSFVIGAGALYYLTPLVAGMSTGALPVAVTTPSPDAARAALTALRGHPQVRLSAFEIALPADLPADQVVDQVTRSVAGQPDDTEVYVEVPRDDRHPELLAALVDSPFHVKLRTGGVRADLYPDEAELAAAVNAVVRAGLVFKATAGLHHAIRNTDPDTGFEQHGFVNLMLATDAALQGADEADLQHLLADRDGARLAEQAAALDEQRVDALRSTFRSFGSCSILEPRDELAALGLMHDDQPAHPHKENA